MAFYRIGQLCKKKWFETYVFFHARSPRPIQNPNESVATLTNHRACAQRATAFFSTRLLSTAHAHKNAPLFFVKRTNQIKPLQNICVFPSKVVLARTARRRERGDHYESPRWRTTFTRQSPGARHSQTNPDTNSFEKVDLATSCDR